MEGKETNENENQQLNQEKVQEKKDTTEKESDLKQLLGNRDNRIKTKVILNSFLYKNY
jgi:ATP-dependent RNA helicase DDX6/DHH1